MSFEDVNNRGYIIGFKHIPTGEGVSFRAFLTSFSDTYVSDWSSETVYGRMDPIDVFRGTRRSISLSWVAVASDEKEARSNLTAVGQLIKMQYPTYTHPSGQTKTTGPSIIEQPPLIRMRFANWVKSMKTTMAPTAATKSSWWSPPSHALDIPTGGLLGHLGGISFSPDIEAGFFDAGGELFPKQINLNGEFTALHEHPMGWYRAGCLVEILEKTFLTAHLKNRSFQKKTRLKKPKVKFQLKRKPLQRK